MGIDDKYNSLGSSLYESDYILFDTEEDDDLELDVSGSGGFDGGFDPPSEFQIFDIQE